MTSAHAAASADSVGEVGGRYVLRRESARGTRAGTRKNMTTSDGLELSVLIIDDEAAITEAIARLLTRSGITSLTAHSGDEALELLRHAEFDAIITDLRMPGLHGLEVLREIRARDLEAPVIVLTGEPDVESASKAIEFGAFRYLTKPFDPLKLLDAVQAAARAKNLATARDPLRTRAALERRFLSALSGMWMAMQPILSSDTREVIGWEALLRSVEPTLPHPGAVIEAAEQLGAVHTLGRHTRALTAAVIEEAPSGKTFFVNLHPTDLTDPDLYDAAAPLSKHARKIVLELTERASLEGVGDVTRRLDDLRKMNFRLAIDDLGAGYAGLNYFALVEPEVVKIDMSLVRNIDRDVIKQQITKSMTALARQLGMEVVGEGVETIAERDMLVSLGCTLLQGFLFGRPAKGLPGALWGEVAKTP